MRVRFVSGKTLRVLDLDDVSQVVVSTDAGDPCSVVTETPGLAVIVSRAGDTDFQQQLRQAGLALNKRVEVVS
jgi:hypothetical protein